MACIKAGIKIVVTIIQLTFALFYAEEKEGQKWKDFIFKCPTFQLKIFILNTFFPPGVDLKIAQVSGDNLFPIRDKLLANDPIQVQEIGTGRPLPKTVHSITAYYGAGLTINQSEIFSKT